MHCCELRPAVLSCVIMLCCRSHTPARGCVPLPLVRSTEAYCTATAVYATPVPATPRQGKDGARAQTCCQV